MGFTLNKKSEVRSISELILVSVEIHTENAGHVYTVCIMLGRNTQ